MWVSAVPETLMGKDLPLLSKKFNLTVKLTGFYEMKATYTLIIFLVTPKLLPVKYVTRRSMLENYWVIACFKFMF